MGNCSESIGTICSKKVNLKCTKYTGIVSNKSTLDPNTCHNGFSTLEDIYTQLNSLFNNLNLNPLGDTCLTYSGKDTEEYLQNILLKFEEEICNIKELLSKRALDLTDLDTKCLKDACDKSPTELLEVLQLIINKLCDTTPSANTCECCTKCVMYLESEGDPLQGLSDAPNDFASSYPNIPLEYIATEPGRYKVQWNGITSNRGVTAHNYVMLKAWKAVGSQAVNPQNPTIVPIPYLNGNNYFKTTKTGPANPVFVPTTFQYEFDIILNTGESVAVDAYIGEQVNIGSNTFIVDKLCLPTNNPKN